MDAKRVEAGKREIRRRRRLGIAVVVLSSAALAAGAMQHDLGMPKSEYVIAGWLKRMERIGADLRAAQWKSAKRSVMAVIREMEHEIESGPASGPLLAQASLYRALAEAGLGDEREASWDFHIAQALYPDYRRVDLSPFGAAGKLLEPHRFDPDAKPEGARTIAAGTTPKPPRRVKSPRPGFPFAKADSCQDGRVTVLVIIGRDGIPRDPQLIWSVDPIFAFEAMDVFRTWRFRPATVGGEPVAVFYSLSINFELSDCRSKKPKGSPHR